MTATAAPTADTLESVEIVPSFVRDAWWTPDSGSEAGAAPVLDASTGELLALVSTSGLDLAAVVDYGRTTGQAELGKLTFHQRALKLKELAQYLNGRREEFYALSAQTGATKIDSMVDIDGGIGVLFTFGSKGRRELPNSQVVVDGPMEVLSRTAPSPASTSTPASPGVAVQINAFNFPVWGMLEKFAPAFIAGVPTIVKPATPTGYVAAAVVKAIVDSGILPNGSLQLVSGSVRDAPGPPRLPRPRVLHRLRLDRQLPEVAPERRARAASGSPPKPTRSTPPSSARTRSRARPEFDAFIKSVVTEMTVKAGQKCTSIRRAIVPQELVLRRRRRRGRADQRTRGAGGSPRRGRHHGRARVPWNSSPTSGPPSSPCSTPAASSPTARSIRRRSPARTGAPASSTTERSCLRCCSAGRTPKPTRSTRWRPSARFPP